jgi:TatA/E family protein of Tat protein translocase
MFEGLLQPTHLILVLIVALIVFGPGKVGDIGGQLGRGIREFRTNMDAGARDAATTGPFCTTCGQGVASSARFCPACGAPQT